MIGPRRVRRMRTVLSAVAQWFRDAWNLPWRLKGPSLGLLGALVAALAVAGVVLGNSGDNGSTAVRGATKAPELALTPTPTPIPTVTLTPSPTPTSTAAPTPTAAVRQPEPAGSQPPPAPQRGLTAAEVSECELAGDNAGWEDAFNLLAHGFTAPPAALQLTTDPAACVALWLTGYDGGYSRGMGDKCNIVTEYIDVASAEELEFCGLERPPHLDEATAIAFAVGWIAGSGDALRAVAVWDPVLHFADLELPTDCSGTYFKEQLWWVVDCHAREFNCLLDINRPEPDCPRYPISLCVFDFSPYDVIPSCRDAFAIP